MTKRSETVAIGVISGVHGVRGEVKLKPWGGVEALDGIEFDSLFIIESKSHAGEYAVEEMRPHKGAYIVALSGVSDRSAAQTLVGMEAAIRKSDLPKLPEGEYYEFEFIGLKVETVEGERLGDVTGIMHAGGNDILEVAGASGEVLIPIAGQTLLEVDVKKRRIVASLPEGLIDANKGGQRQGKSERLAPGSSGDGK